jgi:hypothetical protein
MVIRRGSGRRGFRFVKLRTSSTRRFVSGAGRSSLVAIVRIRDFVALLVWESLSLRQLVIDRTILRTIGLGVVGILRQNSVSSVGQILPH